MDQFVQMFRAAQGGHGVENLARLYGLSAQQAQVATEVLMPAFAEGFRRAMSSPESMAALMSLMMRGPYGDFYSRPASPADLTQAGTNALTAVFGSPEISRAVAQQAATSTGIGVTLIHQMMPAYASLVLGGLTKSLAASGAMQQMVAGLLENADTSSRRPATTGNPFIDAMTRMMSLGQAGTGNPWADAFARSLAPAPQPVRAPSAASAWQDVVNAMTETMAQVSGQVSGQMGGAKGGASAKAPAPPAKAPAPAPLPFQDFFTQMFSLGYPPLLAPAEKPAPEKPAPEKLPPPPVEPSPWSAEPATQLYTPAEFWRDLLSIAAAAATAKPQDAESKCDPAAKPPAASTKPPATGK